MTRSAADVDADREKFDSVDFHCSISKSPLDFAKEFKPYGTGKVMEWHFFAEES
jgi:hypothetical protein